MSDQLPIHEVLQEIKDKLLISNQLILQAPPGAGKSTVLPIQLLNEPWLVNKKILMLEPRRLAARSVANRMAELMNENIGDTVGFRVRFESKVGKNTRLEVLTEGMLTGWLQQDSSLEGIGLIIFDEFHERSLHSDLALALCLEVQQVLREDLRILIMSATLDGESISSVLTKAHVITSKGRQFPITYKYLGNDNVSSISQQVSSTIKSVLNKETGDILVFLPGAGEITKVIEMVSESLNEHTVIYPLYGDLTFSNQQKAILPDGLGRRKIVVSTSIAETSLTIHGIKVVIDSGLSRVPRFDPRSGLTKLETTKVTLATADQRAGRAGRLGPGVCYRLWSEGTHYQLQDYQTPEITDADLAPLVLELAQWGISDIMSVTWISKPPAGAVSQAKDLLQKLGALDKNYKITTRGKEMVSLSTHPRLSHLLLEGKEHKLIELACDVAALLEERDPLPNESSVDLGLRLDALQKWRNKQRINAETNVLERIERLSANWRRIFKCEINTTLHSHDRIGFLIASAYPERIARQKENDLQRFRLANGKVVKLVSISDALDREKWLAVAHLDGGGSEGKIYLAAPLNPEHLTDQMTKKETVAWDYQKGILIAQTELRLYDLIIKTSLLENPSLELKSQILTEVIRKSGLSIFNRSEDFIKIQCRVFSLKLWNPNLDLPDLSDENLIATISDWASSYYYQIKRKEDFRKVDLAEIVKGFFTWEQLQLVEKLAPEDIIVPSGFKVTLQYFPDGRDPVLSVRLQEMFGLLETPTINEGKVKVLLHLLSPGYKPVQVTQDLKSFWKNTYLDVRKELRVRYQKHHWPEDPWTAEAVRGVKKRTL